MESLNGRVARGIAEFNRYRSPEATAKLISNKDSLIEVEFTGHFCRTCGFHDYFDDFVIALEEAGLKAKIESVKEFDEGARVTFRKCE